MSKDKGRHDGGGSFFFAELPHGRITSPIKHYIARLIPQLVGHLLHRIHRNQIRAILAQTLPANPIKTAVPNPAPNRLPIPDDHLSSTGRIKDANADLFG